MQGAGPQLQVIPHGPLVAVGEQDSFAEQALFQASARVDVGAPGQAQFGRVGAGQGGRDDLTDPAGFEDRGDRSRDGVAAAAGAATSEPGLQVYQPADGFAQGLREPARLLVVQRLGSGSAPPGGSPRARSP
jgi:hypothetical protein